VAFGRIAFAGAFFLAAAFLEADVAGTAFLLVDFLGALRFCAGCFTGFLATVFFDFADFLLVFFRVAMGAV
jgi:hypothetical protein